MAWPGAHNAVHSTHQNAHAVYSGPQVAVKAVSVSKMRWSIHPGAYKAVQFVQRAQQLDKSILKICQIVKQETLRDTSCHSDAGIILIDMDGKIWWRV